MDIKARIDTFITDTGVVSVLDVDNEDQVRIVVENADSSNIIQIRGKLRGQSSSSLLKEILGNGNEKVNVSTYEQLIIECTALQPDMGIGSVRIIASSFNLASGSAISIDVPAGSDLTDIETLSLISSDNSVIIEGDNSSKTIDIKAQNPISYTPEDVANKSTNTSLGTSDILYPTQNAVKTYVDSIAVSGAPDADSVTKGILKLTGDLGGTADSPTVPGLASKYDASNPAGYITLAQVPASDVTSVNSQTGAVVLTKSDIGLDQVDNTSDLNKPISTSTQNALDLKQDSLGFTPEDSANKSSDVNLGTSDTLYPTQNAVKTYVDSVSSSGAPDATSSTKGILKLTGDLGGTADSPTVPALANKQENLISGTNIKSINGESILGAGDLVVGGSSAWGAITGALSSQVDLQNALNEKYDASNPDGYISLSEVPVTSVNTQTGAVVLDKSDIGLSNVDNTSDADKPVSLATQTALNDKYDASNPAGYITLAQVPADAVTSVNGLTGAVVVPTSSLIIQDEGTQVTAAAISMNFVGSAVTASSDVSGNVTVSIVGAGDATTLIVEGYNQTGSTIPIMSVVYINGAHGNLPNLVLSQANTEATSSKTLGITRFDISNMSNGFVVATGRLEGLNTDIVEWNEGDSLWLSPSIAGAVTNTKPSAPNHAVFLGTLIRKHPTQGVIEVKVQNGFELQELHNVSISSLSPDQVLKYDSVATLWKNATLTKSDVGLANVDNTSDADKPISSATQTALNGKADSSHTHALTDLTQSSATNGQVPTWNGSNWVASTPASVITDHTLLTNIGTYTHAQIDSHIPASSNVHGIGASSDVVGTATSQTLTNKTIDYNLNTILNLPSGGGGGVTDHTLLTNIGTNSHADIDTHISASSNIHGIGVGNNVVGTGTSQALTNKTIDASLNTVSNIANANISTTAAIARSKIANGTANHVLINTSLGVMSSEAALSASRGGLGTSAAAFTGVVKASAGSFSASTLVNADVSATAAIARSKFASGTINTLVVNSGTGVMTDAAAITASRALISDANGIPTHSTVTSTELGYLSGVTSNLQTQLNNSGNVDVLIAALDINWSAGTTFYKDISVSSTFTFSNVTAGKTITVVINNTSASAVNVTLPTVKKELNGFDTAIAANTANVYTFSSINGSIYASSIIEVS